MLYTSILLLISDVSVRLLTGKSLLPDKNRHGLFNFSIWDFWAAELNCWDFFCISIIHMIRQYINTSNARMQGQNLPALCHAPYTLAAALLFHMPTYKATFWFQLFCEIMSRIRSYLHITSNDIKGEKRSRYMKM